MTYCILKYTLLLIIIPLLNCSSQLDGVIVNSLTLANINQSQSQIYVHKFQNSFEEIPQLALTLIGFECNKQSINSSFHIIPQTIKVEGFIVLWQMNAQKWNRIHLYYMASTRNDILLGCAHAIIPQSYDKNQKQLTLTTFPVPKHSSSIFRTFLLGCDVNNQSVKCGIFPKSLTNSSITVLIEHTGLQNASISFSYIIFSPSSSSFTSYGGFIGKQNFNGYFATDLQKSIGFTPYRFQGLSYIQSGNLNSMKSVINDQFVFRLATDSLIDKFAIFYIILGKSSKILCSNQQLSYQLGEECVASCPTNTYVYEYADGGFSCKTCSKLLNLTLVNGACVTLNENQPPIPSVTSSEKQQIRQQNPKPQQVQNAPSPISCQQNEFLLNNKCVCKIGYSKIGGKCSIHTYFQPEVLPIIVQSIHVIKNTTNINSSNQNKIEILQFYSNDSIISKENITTKSSITTSTTNSNSTDNTASDLTTNNLNSTNSNLTNSTTPTNTTNTTNTINTNNQTINNNSISQGNQTAEIVETKEKTNNLQLVGQIRANSNQVFITLDAINSFDFKDQAQMWRFMKIKFIGCPTPTYYCSQQKTKKNLFDCLIIFPSGIPNKIFTVIFSYNFQQKEGSFSTQIDTLKIAMNASKRKTNSRQMKDSKTV